MRGQPVRLPALILLCGVGLAAGRLSATEERFGAAHAALLAADYTRAFELLLPLAQSGDPRAQAALGLMYDRGHGVPRDAAEALRWLRSAALQGVAAVQHDLGLRYFQGTDVSQDYAEAAKWWRLAAAAGLAESQFNLGWLYHHGLGVPQDAEEALRWYQQAAERDYPRAQYLLGAMYAFGIGTQRDYAKAAAWLRRAAEQDVAEAQYDLGVLLENGQGVAAEPAEALAWYRRAAQLGLTQAQAKLLAAPATPAGPSPTQSPAAPEGAQHQEEWISAQEPSHYTLQIATSTDEQAVLRMLRRIGGQAAYFQSGSGSRVRYTVLYGVFPSYAEAKAALERLPPELRGTNPWVRKFSVLQAQLNRGP